MEPAESAALMEPPKEFYIAQLAYLLATCFGLARDQYASQLQKSS